MDRDRNKKALRLALKNYSRQVLIEWRLALLAFLLPAVGSILVFYVPPLIVARMLTKYSQGNAHSLSNFTPYILWFAALWALGEIVWRIAMYFLARLETRGMRRLYIAALNELLQKDIDFFNNEFGGSLTKKIIGYGRRYEQLLDTIAFDITPQVLPMMFGLVVLWLFSPWLSIILVLFILMALAAIIPLIKRRQGLVVLREAANNAMSGHVADAITNIHTVKSFAREDFEMDIHENLVKDFLDKTLRTWDYHNLRITTLASPFYVAVNAIGLAIAIAVSTSHHLSLTVLFVTFSYYTTATRIMLNFNEIYRTLEASLSDAAQFTDLLLEPPRLLDPSKPKAFQPKTATVEFRDVHFRYDEGNSEHLFENLNLLIKSGEKVALVGHSGGGKTTITKLLLRFMDVTGGQILIDGQNIAEVSQKDLRKTIAYVPQEPAMFHRSLSDNIRYGRQEASQKEVVEAARLSHADDFINKLNDAYDTMVGERGIKLSGGQRQRVAIARAILKDAPILVLDEATSALDSESEKLIQDALWKLMRGKTTIAIAHRLSTIQRMDRIIVLEEGKIVEQGSHTELLATGGVYASLWKHQSGGFLED
ncbi:MAG TPA: ABC transporter ATP-binding protein [Candidatus Saccharimonadales bacterium]|nr:ABC transporter ATP-binding protein [Candidatus Saccharimonadales bacterium]